MLTKQDKKYLEANFAPREEFEEVKGDVSTLKEDVATLKEDVKKLKEDVREIKTVQFDQIMAELKAIREELTVGSYRRRENSDLLDNHETRINKMEVHLGLG